MNSCQLELFADYFQVHIHDEAAPGDLSDAWTREATDRMLAVAPGVVGIGTARNMTVPLTVEVHVRAPDEDFQEWDQVVEASLNITGERIAVLGCTDYFPTGQRIVVRPGAYRVRVSYAGLDTLSPNGLEGADRYRAQLWPAPFAEIRVVKPRSG